MSVFNLLGGFVDSMECLDESGPSTFSAWRQTAYMVFARKYFLFITISAFSYGCSQLFVGSVHICCLYYSSSLFFLLAWACIGHSIATSFVAMRWSGLLEFIIAVIVLSTFLLNLSASTLAKEELVSYRMSCFAVMMSMAALPGCGYAPRYTSCFVTVVFIGPQWLPQSTADLSPLKLLVAISTLCMYAFLHKCARSRFHCLTTAALAKERRNLTLTSRKAFLEKMFDASCICDSDGTVICAASSFREWLDKGIASKVVNLCSILDDDQRFLSYLESSLSVDSTALLLQATMFAGSCALECVCEPVEVRILCVVLPAASTTRESTQTGALFFLGFSRFEQTPNTSLPQHIIDSTMMGQLTFDAMQDVIHVMPSSSVQHIEQAWRQIAFVVIALCTSCVLTFYEVCFESHSTIARVSLVGSFIFGGCGLMDASNHIRMQSSAMIGSVDLTLKICCRICLEIALQCVAFRMDSQCVQHAVYCTTYILLATFLNALMDLSCLSHVTFGSASYLCWVHFHQRMDAIRLPFLVAGIVPCLATLVHSETVKHHMQALKCALTDVHRESSKLEAAIERFLHLEAAMFDFTCNIDASTYIAKASTRPLDDILADSSLPFYLIGGSLQDQIQIHVLLDSADKGNAMEAYVADVMLNLPGRGRCPAKIVAVAQPRNRCQTSSDVLVGLQFGQSDSDLQPHIDVDNIAAWEDDDYLLVDDVFPSDSVTSCQETLFWREGASE